MSLSSINTEALSGAIIAPRTEIRLVLPLPDGPAMTFKSPGLSIRSMASSAVTRAAPDPNAKVTARSSTLRTKHSPRVDTQRRSRCNQGSQNAKQSERGSDDEIHPIRNRHPAHDETQCHGEGLDPEKSERTPDDPANQRLSLNDRMDIAIRCAHRLHRRVFFDIFGGDAVNCLRDQHQADAEAEDGGGRQRSACSGLSQPEQPRLPGKFGRLPNVDVG